MKSIYQSASKLVFIFIGLTVCVSFMLGIMEAKDFVMLAGMAFTYYFTKGSSAVPPSSDTTSVV